MSLGIQTRTALTDEELARRYQATDDPEYFAEIFARHHRLAEITRPMEKVHDLRFLR